MSCRLRVLPHVPFEAGSGLGVWRAEPSAVAAARASHVGPGLRAELTLELRHLAAPRGGVTHEGARGKQLLVRLCPVTSV